MENLKEENIKISVIVPIYNTEKFLEKCIESILNQTLKEIELILVNDGSTDNSYLICEKYAEKDSRILYIKIDNSGCSFARNIGLEKAKGEYITFVDSDDYIEKNMYEEMYKKAKEEDLDCCVCGFNRIDMKKSILKVGINFNNNTKLKEYTKYDKYSSYTWNKIFKKEKVKKLNLSFPLQKHCCEDFFFTFLYLIDANRVNCIDGTYYNYVIHGGNSVKNLKKRLDVFDIFENLYLRLKEKNYFSRKNIKDRFYENFYYHAIKNPFLLTMQEKIGEKEERKKYVKIYFDRLKKLKFLNLKLKYYSYFYKFLALMTINYSSYEKILAIKKKINLLFRRS